VLRARKQAIFVEMEQSVFDALCELWPQAKRRAVHRIVAMVSIGAMRVAMEAWRHDGGKKASGEIFARKLRHTRIRDLKMQNLRFAGSPAAHLTSDALSRRRAP
jgi:hypothetical protein